MSDDVPTGTLPDIDPETRRALARESQRKPPGTGTLGGKSEVMLLIANDVLRFPLGENRRWLLGRFESTDHPDQLDLSRYGAFAKGVSRFHLALHVEDEQLFATDLNSTNGTYLSGEPLAPNKAVLVRNGDELLLGRLAMQVLFR